MENFSDDATLLVAASGPKRDALYIVVPVTIAYACIFVTGLVGNISTCIVIARNKPMHTATNYYLFSLAISDLLLLTSGLPQEMYQIWSRYPYVFGYTFCILRGLFSETSANATVLTITAFTVERYVAICHPFLSHTIAKLSRIVKMIVLIWVVAICCAIPQAFQLGIAPEGSPETAVCMVVGPIEHSFEVSTFLFFVAPMTLITVLYVLIGLKLRSSTKVLKEADSKGSSAKHQTGGQSSKKVLKMLVAVVVAFFICWAPFHAQRLFAIYATPTTTDSSRIYLKVYEIMTYVSGVLYYVSTTINPVLYNIMSNKFRDAFKDTFARCFCSCWDSNPRKQQRTYSVLSRSHRGAESDSGKEDSIQTHSTLIPKSSFDKNKSFIKPTESSKPDERPLVTLSWSKSGPNIKLTVSPKTDFEETQQKKLNKFVRLFNCLAKKSLEENRTYSPTPKDIEERIGRPDLCSITSGDISNSSLRNVDGDSFKDELTYAHEVR